jgi:uncharacterized iron-regulated membrane protein
MGPLRRFVHQPRQLLLRRVLFQIHLWAGVGVGLYLAAMGITGAILVFHEELEHALHHELLQVADAAGPQASVREVMRSAREAYPELPAVALYMPTEDRQTFLAYIKQGDRNRYAYFHPVSAKFLGDTHPDNSPVRWLQDFHFNLLSGKTGRAVNGVGGFLLFVLCVSGMVIWWPGVKTYARALWVDFRRTWKRAVWELHGATGFWALAVLSMWAITGMYFGFAIPARKLIDSASRLSFIEAPVSDSSTRGQKALRDIEPFIAQARELSPYARFSGFQLPAGSRGVFLVFMAREKAGDNRSTDYLYFDQYSGRLLLKWQRGISASWGDTVVSWIVPLHFGTFGGLPVKILWSILGVTPLLLFVSGAVMWWNRKLSKVRYSSVRSESAVGSLATD